MATDHLLRNYAPIPAAGWQQIDDEAKDRLTARLAARRLCAGAWPYLSSRRFTPGPAHCALERGVVRGDEDGRLH